MVTTVNTGKKVLKSSQIKDGKKIITITTITIGADGKETRDVKTETVELTAAEKAAYDAKMNAMTATTVNTGKKVLKDVQYKDGKKIITTTIISIGADGKETRDVKTETVELTAKEKADQAALMAKMTTKAVGKTVKKDIKIGADGKRIITTTTTTIDENGKESVDVKTEVEEGEAGGLAGGASG